MGNSPARTGSRRLRGDDKEDVCAAAAAATAAGRQRRVQVLKAGDPRSPTDGINRTPITVLADEHCDAGATPFRRVGSLTDRWRQRRPFKRGGYHIACPSSSIAADLSDDVVDVVGVEHPAGQFCSLAAEAAAEDSTAAAAAAELANALEGSGQSDTGLMDSKRPKGVSSRRSPLSRLRDSFRGFLTAAAAAAPSPETPEAAAAAAAASPPASAPPLTFQRHRPPMWRRPCRRRRLRQSKEFGQELAD